MLKCTINGKEIEVSSGATIMEAYHKLQEEIAYYCWHPGLSVAGVCRMCMVEIEGNPKLQIACNTPVAEGMKITNESEKVKESVKWTLDFHLINHPLDCPICDQAGECGLQEFYMTYGKYNPEMGDRKVKKHKVVDLGSQVVLDTERCILCSRCVRFTEEVTKTNELGIFNRGDHSEIGTFENRPLNNKYAVNTVDICPVGALTSKDFRFRQRAWYLKEFETTCNGCSTGCRVNVFHNQNGLFRVKPIYDEAVNGHWMCDEGRDIYKHINLDQRLRHSKAGAQQVPLEKALETAKQALKAAGSSAALLITAQYTQEENQAILDFFSNELKSSNIFYWKNNEETFEDFDGLLIRGDKNPNTQGLMNLLKEKSASGSWKDLKAKVESGQIKTVLVAGPEMLSVYPDLNEKVTVLSKTQTIWLSTCEHEFFDQLSLQLPVSGFAEKNGTYVNYAGLERKIQAGVKFVAEALTLQEIVSAFRGANVSKTNEVAL